MSKCRYTRSSSGGTATAPVTEGAWRPIYVHESQVYMSPTCKTKQNNTDFLDQFKNMTRI